jgi:hypothetical protein
MFREAGQRISFPAEAEFIYRVQAEHAVTEIGKATGSASVSPFCAAYSAWISHR